MGLIAKIFPKRALAKARLKAIKPVVTMPNFGSVTKPILTMPAFDAQLFGTKYSPEAPPPITQSSLLSGLPDYDVSGQSGPDLSQSIKAMPKNNLWMIGGGLVIALIAFFALRKK